MLRSRHAALLALLASVAAACATTNAPVSYDFAGWDADGDGFIGRSEFLRGFAATHLDAEWDRDGDGRIDPPEFADATFRAWDHDNDGALDGSEWRASVLRWDADGVDFGPFDTWDADLDGRIERGEFDARLRASDLYGAWDRDLDGAVTYAELGESFYRLWDLDRSGYLDDTEWGDAELLAFHTGIQKAARSKKEDADGRAGKVSS